MLAGFTLIEQYKNLSKDIEDGIDVTTSNYDQQVPLSRYTCQDYDLKVQIKLEEMEPQSELFSIMESIISTDLSNSADTESVKSCAYFNNANTTTKGIQIKPTTSSTSLSSSSFLSTISPPLSNFSSSSTSLRSSPTSCSSTTHFLSEMPATTRNAVPNIDFLSDNDNAFYDHDTPDNSSEYIDMDKQQISFYENYQTYAGCGGKNAILINEPERLEEAAIFIREAIYNEFDDINISYDPTTWTPDDVRKWVSWVCQKNGVPDVTSYLFHFDGPTLCSLNQDTFAIICGEPGKKLFNELELWKAANSCFSTQANSHNSNEISCFSSQQQNSSVHKNYQAFTVTPCASPALSSCSSNQDTNISSTSTHLYHSDDESIYRSELPVHSISAKFDTNARSKVPTKMPTGRGHKQTIHLWQFLQELLLSKDNKYSDCIRWLDHRAGVFKIEDSKRVATLWGARKNRPAMNYDKLSRSVRQYYKKGIIKKTEQSKRLVYQFCAGYL